MEGIGKGAQGKGQSGLKGLRPLCLGLVSLGEARAWLGCPRQLIVWRRPQAGSVLFPLSVSLSLFPLQQLRLTSASWGWAKGWRGGRGALVPAQASTWALSPCPACCWPKAVAGPGSQPPGTIPPGLASLLWSVSWLSCKGRDEPNPAELLQDLPGPPGDSRLGTGGLAPCARAVLLQVLGRHILHERGPGGMAEKAKAAGGRVTMGRAVHLT